MAVNRYYSSTAVDTTLSVGVASSTATTIQVVSTTGFPTSYPYTLAIGFDLSTEELVNVVGASGTTLKIGTVVGTESSAGRGVDGTTAQTHDAGVAVKHVFSARDMREAQEHIAGTTSVHGITDTSALATKTGTETLTNKTLTAPAIASGTLSGTLTNSGTISGGSITGTAITGGSITGTVGGNPTFSGTVTLPSTTSIGAVSATELGYVDGVTSNIQTQLNAKASSTGVVTSVNGATGAVTNVVKTTDSGTVTSTMIADGTIVDADINASAAIAQSKVSGLTTDLANRAYGLTSGTGDVSGTNVTISSTSSTAPTTIQSFVLTLDEQCDVLITSNVAVTAGSGSTAETCNLGVQVAGATIVAYTNRALVGGVAGSFNAAVFHLVRLNAGDNTILIKAYKSGGTFTANYYNTFAVPVKALA